MMNVAVTGYNGSGASAVVSFLMEYDETQLAGRNPYEHILFYTPNGLFDLEYKLLYCNNMLRSDEALNSFALEMERLYKNDYVWMGGYKKICGDDFMLLQKSFIKSYDQDPLIQN